jgi:TfoX/Sxy family transcriptional regulator of competence genes
MPIGDLAFLMDLLERATERLPGIAKKRLFGCDALFVDGSIFALVWKEGRIGLKFLDPATFAARLATPGAKPWAPSGKAMGGWVLVPETLHDDEETLTAWARESHASVRAGAMPAPKASAKPAAKSTSVSKAKAKSRSKAATKAKARATSKPRR